MVDTVLFNSEVAPIVPNVPIVHTETGFPTSYFQTLIHTWLREKKITEDQLFGLGMDGLADVDTVSDVPTTGDLLIFDGDFWVPFAPGASGKVLTSAGDTNMPTWETPTAGGIALNPPTIATFPTQLSIGAESFLLDTDDGLAFSVGTGGAGTVVRCILKSLPSVPYTITFKMDGVAEGVTSDGMGLILRDSATGRLLKFGMQLNAAPHQVIVERWTTNTSFSAASKTATSVGSVFPWLRVTDNNTNLVYEWALTKDGPWMPFFSEARTAWLANANQVGFGIEDQNDTTYMMLIKDYTQS